MGTLFKMVIAFGIGVALLKGAQHFWLQAVQHRMEEAAQAPPSFAVETPVIADFSKMQRYIDNRPQIDWKASQQAGFQGQFQEMQLRNQAAQMGAPQIANGIPTMPGQGVPLQYMHH